jgi:hypothetical protein
MGFNEEYMKLRKKREEEEKESLAAAKKRNTRSATASRFEDEYQQLRAQRIAEEDEDDIAPVLVGASNSGKMTVKEAMRAASALKKANKGFTDSKDEEDEDKERGWFEKGAFEDGYQFGDVIKTIAGTSRDAEESVMAGILGIGEKVVDAGATAVGAVGSLFSKDFGDKTKEFVAKDLYDEREVARKLVGTRNLSNLWADSDNSVLGAKTDDVLYSGGQLAATLALQTVGVPWYATTGTTSFGAETENAFNNDATYGEAIFSGAVAAGSEILTEKLFGGSGLGEKGLINLAPLTKGISNVAVKALADFGIDVLAEGSEEVFSEFFSTLGQKLSYEKEDTWKEILTSEDAARNYIYDLGNSLFGKEARERYGEAAVGGAFLGGVMNASNVTRSARSGRDYRTELSKNEKSVFDKEYADRLAEAEKIGETLTKKDKGKIYDEVMEDLKKGQISTDTIEEVLGGESYKSYRDTVESEDATLKEFEELGKVTQPSLAQQARYTELQEAVKGIKEGTARSDLKTKLTDTVRGLLTRDVKGRTLTDDFLLESYNEQTKRGKVFGADIEQYDEKEREVVQKAIDSGILNDTRRTHEFVGTIAKISAQTGTPFDFTNNAKLKESGYAVEGADINGVYTKDGIKINMDSHKAWQSTVGHEITHVLEGTEFYTQLQSALFDYAKSKNDYQGRYDTLTKLYKGVEGANVDAELTADLVGDYLFTDADFVNHLSTKNRNVFQRVYDEIKHLLKMVTAGSKEARQLEQVKRAFDKAYKNGGKGAEGTKYSISDSTGKQLTSEQQKYFADSKVRDDAGNLMVMYHGTPNGDFTVFKDGTYFTENKWYADLYQNPGASSISTGKVATNPKTYEVYLNIRKPFDISDAEARSIYINDYIKGGNAVGINPYLSDAEYAKIDSIDWTEGEDLREFLIDNGYDYDGLVLDEGAVGGYGDDVKYRGKSYVVFSPDQVKNVDNVKPTGNTDIRYSLTEYTAEEKKAHNDAVLKHFGKTYKWAETGYLLLDGTRLDLSGKHDGAPGGYRTVDHRDITDALGYDYGGGEYSDSLIQFMSEGNIRIVPEIGGINLSVKPTKAQEQALSDFISRNRGEVVLDIDDSKGNTIVSVEYPKGTYFKKVLEDIREWFDNGKQPEVSGLSQFRSLSTKGEAAKVRGRYATPARDLRYEGKPDIAPVSEDVQDVAPVQESVQESVQDAVPEGFAPIPEEAATAIADEGFASLTDADMPPEIDAQYGAQRDAITLDDEAVRGVVDRVTGMLGLDAEDAARMAETVQAYAQNPDMTDADLFNEVRDSFKYYEEYDAEDGGELQRAKAHIRGTHLFVPENLKGDFDGRRADGFNAFRREHFGHFHLTTNEASNAIGVDALYAELTELYPDLFPADIWNAADQLKRIGEVAAMQQQTQTYEGDFDEDTINEVCDIIRSGVEQYSQSETARLASEDANSFYDSIGAVDIAPIGENVAREQTKTSEPVTREAFKQREGEIYKKIAGLSSGKYHKVGDYGFHIARSSAQGHATITVNTPDKQKLQSRIPDGKYMKNTQLWHEAARMVAEHEMPNVEKITPEEAKKAKIAPRGQKTEQPKRSLIMQARTHLVDDYSVFEDLALKHKNRELDAKANFMRSAEQRAQYFMTHGAEGVRPIADILSEVEKSGYYDEFQEYMHDMHNTDRMSLEDKARPIIERLRGKFEGLRPEQIHAIAGKKITGKTTERTAQTIRDAREYLNALGAKNKAVWGWEYTAEMSSAEAEKAEAQHPEFKQWAQDIYDNMAYLLDELVKDGEISKETADLFARTYPHYIPMHRVKNSGVGISVPLDTNKTGVNAPIKRATGGDSDFYDMFETIGERIVQTFKAGARNRFGLELMNTLGTRLDQQSAATSIDEAIEGVDTHEERLKKGENGAKPTFTVFENGKRVEFEITEDMYDALKPKNDLLSRRIPGLSHVVDAFKKVTTEYSPKFMASNPPKDLQSVLVNSQHPVKTYVNYPVAIKELGALALHKKAVYAEEYLRAGGDDLSYFDTSTNEFKNDSKFKKVVGFIPRKISEGNKFFERATRLAEYIASRKAGASIEVAMLDAARVTTNFSAGGDVTKFLNRNFVPFLNPSVQGAAQQVRNVREAAANGFVGCLGLAARYAAAGLPILIFNALMWGDDDEYEELSDYVKENYYIVAKFGDGKFVRIPKGREVAVIQDAVQQAVNAYKGEETDWSGTFELAKSNLAPNSVTNNNILSPIKQVITNETWYGEELIPTRLQDVPAAEQYDESTDLISKWLGEKTNTSPMKWNYLINQYTGGIGDMVLPMFTPEAESGDNSRLGNIIAPWKDLFTTDSVMNNQNVSDFYDTVDELTKNANSMYATDEDILKSKYMSSVNADLSELYQQKREIQNSSDLSDADKYKAVREVQKKIDDITRESLATYGSVNIDGVYATVGDRHYRWYEPGADSDAEPGWQKITAKQLEKQQEVTSGLGISASDYWSNKEEYDYAYDSPGKYAVAKSVGGYSAWKTYSSELYDIKADKDESGKSISGSRKEKVADYINGLDAEYGEKIILFKSEYNADDTYNMEIIEYLNSRDDISYKDMETILKELGFTVDSKGNIYWD